MAKLTLGTITSAYQAVPQLNANNALIEAAFENTLSRDGTTPNSMSANFDVNSNRVLNVASAVSGSDAPNYGQVQDLITAASGASLTGPIAATLITITDTGGYYTATDVETALQEIFTVNPPIAVGTITDSVLRWSGTAWTQTDVLKVGVAGIDIAGFRMDMSQGTIRSTDGVSKTVDIRSDALTGNLTFEQQAGTPSVDFDLPVAIMDDFYFLERATGPTSAATQGHLWVRNDAPNTLMFTDDAGTEFPLSTENVTTAWTDGTARTSTATLADDPDLVVTLEPGDYTVEGYINWGQSGGGGNGIRMKMNVNSGTVTGGSGSLVQADQVATPDGQADLIVLDIDGSERVLINTDLDEHRGHYRGVVTVTTTAEIAFQWAQQTSHPDSVAIGKGFLRYTKVG